MRVLRRRDRRYEPVVVVEHVGGVQSLARPRARACTPQRCATGSLPLRSHPFAHRPVTTTVHATELPLRSSSNADGRLLLAPAAATLWRGGYARPGLDSPTSATPRRCSGVTRATRTVVLARSSAQVRPVRIRVTAAQARGPARECLGRFVSGPSGRGHGPGALNCDLASNRRFGIENAGAARCGARVRASPLI
jgi:hypothetical protein